MGRHCDRTAHDSMTTTTSIPHGIGTGDFTLIFFTKIDSAGNGTDRGIVGFGSPNYYGPDIYLNTSNGVTGLWVGESLGAGFTITPPTDVWILFVVLRDAGDFKIAYCTQGGSVVWCGNPRADAADLVDGKIRFGNAANDGFLGDFQRARLYPGVVLAGTTIETLAEGYLADYGSPFCDWPMLGVDDPEPEDANGYALTLAGTSASSDDPISGGGPPGSPENPSSLLVISTTTSSIAVSWVDNGVVPYQSDGFTLEYDTDPEFGSPTDIDVQLGVGETTAINLDELTRYYFRVAAYNENGQSGWSNVVSTTTTIDSPDSDIPDIPLPVVFDDIIEHRPPRGGKPLTKKSLERDASIAGPTSVGISPLSWTTFFGSTPVEVIAFEPDATSFRGTYYYNSSLNILFKRVLAKGPLQDKYVWKRVSQ
jgi:hypothetical protein